MSVPLKTFLTTLFLMTFVAGQALAQTTGCGDYRTVKGYGADKHGMVLCLVAGKGKLPWKKPRQILFADETSLLVTDFGSWGNRKRGKLWSLNLKTMKARKIYDKGDRTHGLAVDRLGRILLGDAGRILRQSGDRFEAVVTGLPKEGNHPMSHMILLPNQDLIINVGAPSDQCKKEMKASSNKLTCASRDSEAELRRYFYDSGRDGYGRSYNVVGRGLRNSMALLFNSLTGELYQAENSFDSLGITEEFNVMSLDVEGADIPDFGWPFCSGFGERNPAFGRSFRTFCDKVNVDPAFLVPAHSAPLDMEYYRGGLFKDLDGAILMSWHGHRRAVDYSLVAYLTDGSYSPLVSDPNANGFVALLKGKNRAGDKIRPVGVTTDHLGRIWFVDDRTGKLFMLTKAKGTGGQGDADDSARPAPLQLSQSQKDAFADWYFEFSRVENCTACHQEMVTRRPFDSLELMLAKGWLRREQDATAMPFIGALSGKSESFRPMPPAPDKAFAETEPQLFQWLMDWAADLD